MKISRDAVTHVPYKSQVLQHSICTGELPCDDQQRHHSVRHNGLFPRSTLWATSQQIMQLGEMATLCFTHRES